MKGRDAILWRQVIDELANGLQVAVGLATQVRQESQTTADDAVLLEQSLAGAVSALKRLQQQPSTAKRSKP
jgi:hypothetical protein